MKQNKTTTIEDLKAIMLREFKAIIKKFDSIDKRFDDVDKKFLEQDEKARGNRDDVLNKMDKIIGELEQRREEEIFIKHDINELKTITEKHEKEITALKHS